MQTSTDGLLQAQTKMREEGVGEEAVEVFTRYYHQLQLGDSGLIPESEILAFTDPPSQQDIQVSGRQAAEALRRTAIIKLNGGLGTSMGLDKAKTLLPVRDGKNFLDIIVRQVLAARQEYQASLPVLFLTSFRTDQDTNDYLARYPQLPVGDLPLTFSQSQQPKLLQDDLTPVQWPADPELEWCPPGHGDIYPALVASGVLDQLIEGGYRYAAVSNGDNLGATPSADLAGWFAASGAPFAMEVCRRTANDRKGGHLARRHADDRLVLRESAQTPEEDAAAFADETIHPYFNTNNLWLDLVQLREALAKGNGHLGLPLIRNVKTVDPADPDSPTVIQIESAMGAAVEVFPEAQAIEVPRSRFLPVKTTDDLLLLRSDTYRLTELGELVAEVSPVPRIRLDPSFYGTVDSFDLRIPRVPSLREATEVSVEGDWWFQPDVSVTGDLDLRPPGGTVGTGRAPDPRG